MFCPHKLNPQTCLQCYHAKVSVQPKSQPKPRAHVPNPSSIIARVKEANGGVFATQKELEPTVVQPVHVGFDAKSGEAIKPKEAPAGDGKLRGPMPRPVLASGEGGGAPGTPASGGRVLAPYSYASEPMKTKEVVIAGHKQTIEVPRQRRELIDSLPRHPQSGGGSPVVR